MKGKGEKEMNLTENSLKQLEETAALKLRTK